MRQEFAKNLECPWGQGSCKRLVPMVLGGAKKGKGFGSQDIEALVVVAEKVCCQERKGLGRQERRGLGSQKRKGSGRKERKGLGSQERKGFDRQERKGFGSQERKGLDSKEGNGFGSQEEKAQAVENERAWCRGREGFVNQKTEGFGGQKREGLGGQKKMRRLGQPGSCWGARC